MYSIVVDVFVLDRFVCGIMQLCVYFLFCLVISLIWLELKP